uniref:Protein Vpu n=1 Tax=Human immunodeficiency virus type 1 TaxID=11676 RepID=D6P168_HV1|nr:vpu protein [Human immunodeficiency virus 1]
MSSLQLSALQLSALQISAIVALVVAAILAIVVWTIVLIQYRQIVRQRKIDSLLDRIIERAEDSGNESEGDQEELSALVGRGHLAPWNIDDL